MYKIDWIAGMSRSASMWSMNVTRALLELAGKEVYPKQVLQTDGEMEALSAKALQDQDERNV